MTLKAMTGNEIQMWFVSSHILYICVCVCVFVVALSSDDLLPILIYLVVKTEMPSWSVSLHHFYLQEGYFNLAKFVACKYVSQMTAQVRENYVHSSVTDFTYLIVGMSNLKPA